MNFDKYIKNFNKTFELIDLVFKLKEAYVKKTHPDWTDSQIEKKIYDDMLKRKKIK